MVSTTIRIVFVCLLCQIVTSCFAQKGKASDNRPNIIYIMSDDHTTQAIGAYGSRLASLNPTPVLDQLAKDGMLFTSVFCTNSICTPSRATIISGQYSQTNGVLDLDGSLPIAKQYLPIELKKLGYTTAMIGKWHLEQEPASFDYYKVLPGQGKYFDPVFHEKGKGTWPNNEVNTTGHSTDVITDITIDYLSKRDKSKPFFLMHHYKAPHDFFEFAPRYTSYLEKVEIPEPASMYAQPFFGSEATRGRNDSLVRFVGTSVSNRHQYRNYAKHFHLDSLNDEKLITHLAYQEYLKRYLRCVKGVDDNLKRLFDYLKKEGLWENTVIVYTGDQGMMLGEHDLQDKRWMYDESMRMPFIMHYPKVIRPGSRSDLLINNTDFAPTLIELAGGKAPAYMQGMSFVNTVKGGTEKNWRDATYYRYWMNIIHHWVPAHFGIRTKEYKLIFYYGKHYLPESEFSKHYWNNQEGLRNELPVAWELYDLRNDPEELHNRYNDPAYKNVVAQLKAQLKKARQQYNETDENYPEIQKVVEAHWND